MPLLTTLSRVCEVETKIIISDRAGICVYTFIKPPETRHYHQYQKSSCYVPYYEPAANKETKPPSQL